MFHTSTSPTPRIHSTLARTPETQAWIDFEVEDLEKATAELKSRGYRLLVAGRKEPWGQIVTRLISPEGLLVAITVTPWLRATK
ncbi:MAG: VOC family protein [Candidatus Acidiferrales bacterium]